MATKITPAQPLCVDPRCKCKICLLKLACKLRSGYLCHAEMRQFYVDVFLSCGFGVEIAVGEAVPCEQAKILR